MCIRDSEFTDHRKRLGLIVVTGRQYLHASLADRVDARPFAAGGLPLARRIYVDRMRLLHALRSRFDHPVGGGNDVRCGAIIVRQEGRPGGIVGLEVTDEFDRGAVKSVNVLVVVADGEEVDTAIFIAARATSKCRNQRVLFRRDILILINQNPAEAGQQALALLVGVLRRQAAALEQADRCLLYTSRCV